MVPLATVESRCIYPTCTLLVTVLVVAGTPGGISRSQSIRNLLTDFSKAAQDMSKKLRKKVSEQIKHGPTQKPTQNKSLGFTSRTALLESVPGQSLGIELVIYGSDCNSGAVVTGIAPGSPADKCGQVFAGDVIIVSLGRAAVESHCARSLFAKPVVRVTHFA